MLKKFLPVQRWARVLLLFVVFLTLAFWGLWQIDMVRQTIRIEYMILTGKMWELHGRTEKLMMQSDALDQKRQVIVYLPPGYDLPANRNRRYPVFYLIHGFPDTGDGWVRWGIAPQLVDQSIVNGALPPFIMAMPDSHGAIGQFGDGEYLDAPTGHGKRGTNLATYIVHNVPEWVDLHYRTVATPKGRVIGGESTGGYGAVNLGLQHPDVFGTMLSLSGYFEVDKEHFGKDLWPANPDPARIRAESPLAFVPLGTESQRAAWRNQFVYLGNGLRDYHEVRDANASMEACLTKAGIPFIHHQLPGRHSWDQWRITLVDGLETIRPRLSAAEWLLTPIDIVTTKSTDGSPNAAAPSASPKSPTSP